MVLALWRMNAAARWAGKARKHLAPMALKWELLARAARMIWQAGFAALAARPVLQGEFEARLAGRNIFSVRQTPGFLEAAPAALPEAWMGFHLSWQEAKLAPLLPATKMRFH